MDQPTAQIDLTNIHHLMLYPNIPSQVQGEFEDIVSMQCADNLDIAKKNFEEVQKRLVSVNQWHKLSDKVKTEFTLMDAESHQPTSDLNIDNLIRIDIPGPGSPSGKGYDWTKIIDIQDGTKNKDTPFFAITIKPCTAPDNEDDNVAHFYTENASNTFIVRRVGTCIYAEVHGRNQIQNTSNVPVLDTLRNKAVTMGANLGLGGLNWLAFTKAVLKPAGE